MCDRRSTDRSGPGPWRLTTSRRRGATGFCRSVLAPLALPALRAASLQNQIEILAIWYGLGNWILRYNAAVVFYIDIQICARNHSAPELQDFCEPIRSKAMIGVITDMGLQNDLLLLSSKSTAIDKTPGQMSNFGEMSVCGNVISGWENKARERCGMLFENILQCLVVHASDYIPI